jgi:hypothetical protein
MKLESKVKKFPGHVILPDYLNIGQVRAFEESLGDINTEQADVDKKVWISITDEKRLPVVLMCVTEWHIEKLPDKPTLDTFPMTPLASAHQLIEQIYTAILELWTGEQVPNE